MVTRSDRVTMRKQPSQSRSRSTVSFILQAATQVFTERGYDHGSTNRIADRAGVSIGTLYQYFPNKEAIVLWAVRRQARKNVAAITRQLDDARISGVPTREAIRQAVTMTVRQHTRFGRLQREGLHRAPALRNQIHTEIRALMEPGIEATVRLLEADEDLELADPRFTAVFIVETLHERCHWLVDQGSEHGVEEDGFIEELVALFDRYLKSP